MMDLILHYARIFGALALFVLIITSSVFVIAWATILYSLFN